MKFVIDNDHSYNAARKDLQQKYGMKFHLKIVDDII